MILSPVSSDNLLDHGLAMQKRISQRHHPHHIYLVSSSKILSSDGLTPASLEGKFTIHLLSCHMVTSARALVPWVTSA